MSLCPWCDKELVVARRALYTADTCAKKVTAKAECCGAAVNIQPIRQYEITPVFDRKEDDWGEEIKQ